MSTALHRVEAALRAVGSRRVGQSWQCPAHEDSKPSLSVGNSDGKVLLRCWKDCKTEDVVRAMGLEMRDLYDDAQESRRIVARYPYTAEAGELLYEVVRYEPKDFRQRRPDGKGGWSWKLGDVRRVLYRLPEVIAAVQAGDTVYVVEGESDVDALHDAKKVATCNSGGAGRWRPEFSEFLRGADVIIVADRDEPGWAHAKAVSAHLTPKARSVRVVEAKAGKDSADHLAAGHSVEDFVAVNADETDESMSETPRPSPTFTGDRLLELLKRPRPEPIANGRPVPGHLLLVIAAPFMGKTSLALWSAMSRASGVAPWPNVPKPEPGAVLIVSPDESAEQLVRRMNGLALFHPAGPIERYAENLFVLAPDPETEPKDIEGLRFDQRGLELLERALLQAAEEGRPFREVYLDAYADFIPLDESENSNETATRVLGFLERLAIRTGAAISLLHHAGKPRADSNGELPDVRFLARGASALAAKARAVMAIDVPAGMAHVRRVRAATNLGPAPKPLMLQVCEPEADGEELLYFKPSDPLRDYQPGDFLTPGQAIPTRRLAELLSPNGGGPDGEPSGDIRKLATALREHWRREGLIEVESGPRNAKMLRLLPPLEEARGE